MYFMLYRDRMAAVRTVPSVIADRLCLFSTLKAGMKPWPLILCPLLPAADASRELVYPKSVTEMINW
jgi:hypothetical protein